MFGGRATGERPARKRSGPGWKHWVVVAAVGVTLLTIGSYVHIGTESPNSGMVPLYVNHWINETSNVSTAPGPRWGIGPDFGGCYGFTSEMRRVYRN